MSILQAQHLSSHRGHREVLADFSFEGHQGEIIYIQGGNGVGKTTLLRTLAGLHHPVSGKVCYQARDIADCWDEYCRNLVYIGHKPGVNGLLTVEENLRAFHRLAGASEPLDTNSVLAAMDLTDLASKKVNQLSAGQQVRVALSRLYLAQFRAKSSSSVWLLDEPFTALDSLSREILCQLITQQASKGGLVIFTSHQAIEFQHPMRTITLEAVVC